MKTETFLYYLHELWYNLSMEKEVMTKEYLEKLLENGFALDDLRKGESKE